MIALLVLSLVLIGAYMAGKRRSVAARAGTSLDGDSPARPSKQPLSIGIYNIHRARGTDTYKSIDRIADVIGNTDIVGLCECEGGFYGLTNNQAAQLGERLGRFWQFNPTQYRWLRDDRGNGLLSRWQCQHWQQIPLIDSTGTHPRCLTEFQFQLDGISMAVLVTHLSRRIDQEAQFAVVMQRLRAQPRAILLGDLNITREFAPLALALDKHHIDDAIELALTEQVPDSRIDWILSRGVEITGGDYQPEGASDHPFYRVMINLAPTQSA